MSDEQVQQVEQPPVAPLALDDTEKAYFESRGEKGPQVDDNQEPVAPTPVVEKPAAPRPEPTAPIAALQEERAKRQEAERQYNERLATLQGRLDQMAQFFQPPQQQVEQVDDDPFAAQQAKIAQIENELNARRAQEYHAQQHAQLGARFDAAAQAFSQTEPHFVDAVKHLVETRKAELQAMPGVRPEAIQQLVAQDMFNFLRACEQDGVNPAERAWQWSQARGFRKPEPKPNDAVQQMQTIERGQAAARTVGHAGGGPGGEITLESLADMPQAEFAAWLSKNGSAWKRLNGA